ncbi:MAG: hypothetical protein U9O56_07285 [Campylobacterota bacterium]|nr:hypothetical protein [Campylobacterota bacterium]
MKKEYFFLAFMIFSTISFAFENSADCLILEDENSIICKYTHERIQEDHNVTFQWIEPNERVTRTRKMIIPALHGSVYDYRYIKGRTKGKWTFKVIDEDQEFSTNFTIE